MLLLYYSEKLIPFGGFTVLRMDLFHQYGPLFAELYDRIVGVKSFLYSWNTGGGGAFLGNYFNYLSSPVGDIIALIAGHGNIPEAIGTMVLVKNGLSAAALAYFLKKKFGKNDFTISAFGIMYAFCGFFIAYYWNIMWIDAMYLLPLAVLGLEKIVNERRCRLYVITLAYSFFANYYMSYMLCIFAILYFLVYFISRYSFSDSYPDIPVRIDKNGNEGSSALNRFLYNRFLRSGFLFAASSVIAVALVAFAVIPTYFCLKECSATSGSFPEEYKFYNSIFDFLANHIASLEPTIRSSGDTVLPNVYCGVLTIILVPLYIFCDRISAKERAAHIVLLAVFFTGFNLNYVNYVFHAFHFPNDLPFRFSFIYSFLLIIMAYRVITHIKDISSKAILASGAGIILFTVIVEEIGMENVHDYTVYITISFAALYTVILGIMRKKEYARSAVALLLLCSVFAEAAIADIDHFKITQEKVNFVNGYSDFRSLKSVLDEKEGSDKYRLELTDINTLMDASWFNYNGISVFSSMAYEKSANLQNQLGLDSNYINSYIYYSQTPVYNAMMSLKYLVQNDDFQPSDRIFSRVAGKGKFTAYENRYYLPLAFCVSERMKDFDITSTDPFYIQDDFWYYATGTSGVLKQITAADYETENVAQSEEYKTDSFTCFKENSDADGTLKINFIVPEDQLVYLYFDSSDVDTVKAYTADESFNKEQSIDEPYVLDCGYLKKDEILTVEVNLDGETDSCSAECYVYGLDMEVFEAGYEILKPGAMTVEEFSETHIKGKVTSADGKMLYTSINYDDGWTVKVDGKKVKKEKIGGALIGVDLEAGEHEIEFSYIPKGLIPGFIISACALLLVILFAVLKSLSGRIKENLTAKKNRKSSDDTDSKDEYIYKEDSDSGPRGLEALMQEDLNRQELPEQNKDSAENESDYPEIAKPDSEYLSKADEILSSEKLDLSSFTDEFSNTEE